MSELHIPGQVIIKESTSDIDAIAALVRMFFSFRFTANRGELLEILFTRHTQSPVDEYQQEIIVTHRSIDPMMQLRNAFRAAWARMNANQCLVIKFEIKPIYFGEDKE